jgi:hypothetical protein
MTAKGNKKLEVVEEMPDDDVRPTGADEAPPPDQPIEELEMVAIPFRGRDFNIPKMMDEWETEACLAMSQNDYVYAAKLLLGEGQWARLQMLGSKRKDIREFLLIFAEKINKECIG